MRLLKLLGLAAIAALAAMAFVASPASADVLCLEQVESCPAGSIWGDGENEFAIGLSEAAVLTASSIFGPVEVTCKSTALAKNLESRGPHESLHGLIHSLTFTNCKGGCEFVTGDSAENLPYLLLALALPKPHIIITKHAEGAGPPAALLNNCLGSSSIDCLYEAKEPLLDIEGDLLIALNVALTRNSNHGSGFCPGSGTWNAKYLVEQDLVENPQPLYLAALP